MQANTQTKGLQKSCNLPTLHITLIFLKEILIYFLSSQIIIISNFRMLFRFRKHISFLLLLTICLFVVPKEYFHDLYGHEDTKDITQQQQTLGKAHQHCEILGFNTPHYIFQYKIFLLSASFIQQIVFEKQQSVYIIPFSFYFNLRAPPAEAFTV